MAFICGCSSFGGREAYIRAHSLDAFITERPKAAELLRQHPALEQWLRAEWKQTVEGYQVVWLNEPRFDSSDAENVPDHNNRLIAIRVSEKLSPLDQLIALSFETCNARGLTRFDALVSRAAAGQISRADFVDGIEATEYEAVLRLKGLLPNLLPPKGNTTGKFYPKLLAVPPEFKEYQAWNVRIHGENYLKAHDLYGRRYDEITKARKAPLTPGTEEPPAAAR